VPTGLTQKLMASLRQPKKKCETKRNWLERKKGKRIKTVHAPRQNGLRLHISLGNDRGWRPGEKSHRKTNEFLLVRKKTAKWDRPSRVRITALREKPGTRGKNPAWDKAEPGKTASHGGPQGEAPVIFQGHVPLPTKGDPKGQTGKAR